MTRLFSKGTSILVIVILFITVATVAILAGCAKGQFTLKKGKLLMGCDTDVIPFAFEEKGTFRGFDVELARAIAGHLGLELKIVPTHWLDLFPDLKSDKYDMVMNAVTITSERNKALDFSDPYFETDQSILVKKGSPVRKGADLKGKVIGTLAASTPLYAAQKLEGLKEIKTFDTITQCYENLLSGNVDAMIMDKAIASYRSKEFDKTEVIALIASAEEYGIAVKKGNKELLDRINGALKETRDNGTYDLLYREWFGE